MRNIVFLLALFVCSFSVLSQNSNIIDSLKLSINKLNNDSSLAKTFNELAYYYLYQDIDSSIIYGKKALNKSIDIRDKEIEAKANYYIGTAFLYSNEYDSAKVYLNKSSKISEEEGLNKSHIYSSLGILYKNEENYEKAIETYFEGIEYDEKKLNDYGKGVKLLNIANVYSILEDYDKSIKFLLDALEIVEETKDENLKFAKGTILNNIGSLYTKMNKFDEGLDFFERSLAINIENDNKKEIARNYNNIGSVHEKKNYLNRALPFLKKALSIRQKLKDIDELVETHMELGVIYGKMKDLAKSKIHFDKAIAYAESIDNLNLLSETYLAKSNSLYELKRVEPAFQSFKSHIHFKDSVFKIANLEKIQEIETKYETAKKNKEIATQQLELKDKETQIQKEKTQNNYMLGAIVFLAIATTLLVFLFKQRQKRKNQELLTLKREFQIKTLESLIEGEEKERHRVAKELHDGVNGDLAAIKYKLSSLLEMNNNVIKEAITMIDDSCKQVRAISHNLIPPSLENFNLLEATEVYCSNLNDVTEGLEITFQHLGESIEMSKKAEVNAFRIIQELVTNAVRHAEASQINVQISSRDNTVQITVEDDGKGFDKNNIESDGIGLSNIQSRVDYLNATTDFISNNQGTSYTVDIHKDKVDGN
ncbi:tetratricopeptide repeat protein [Seonamhaeicola algicola]|uniref:histidine kinase n=1 Tax=Seonamhaeicola algicola TaxID=1719036 RepID=A0A5C7AWR3_9FLAO|nr:sensor histidine kinase [Seonamhaeicola algicola]TXE10122.1 tetratricopeptide repeat protein [Seonamhaeicola algicola]